jgi:hypothetical protein
MHELFRIQFVDTDARLIQHVVEELPQYLVPFQSIAHPFTPDGRTRSAGLDHGNVRNGLQATVRGPLIGTLDHKCGVVIQRAFEH